MKCPASWCRHQQRSHFINLSKRKSCAWNSRTPYSWVKIDGRKVSKYVCLTGKNTVTGQKQYQMFGSEQLQPSLLLLLIMTTLHRWSLAFRMIKSFANSTEHPTSYNWEETQCRVMNHSPDWRRSVFKSSMIWCKAAPRISIWKKINTILVDACSFFNVAPVIFLSLVRISFTFRFNPGRCLMKKYASTKNHKICMLDTFLLFSEAIIIYVVHDLNEETDAEQRIIFTISETHTFYTLIKFFALSANVFTGLLIDFI